MKTSTRKLPLVIALAGVGLIGYQQLRIWQQSRALNEAGSMAVLPQGPDDPVLRERLKRSEAELQRVRAERAAAAGLPAPPPVAAQPDSPTAPADYATRKREAEGRFAEVLDRMRSAPGPLDAPATRKQWVDSFARTAGLTPQQSADLAGALDDESSQRADIFARQHTGQLSSTEASFALGKLMQDSHKRINTALGPTLQATYMRERLALSAPPAGAEVGVGDDKPEPM
jgi:hypothetical protein